MAHDVIVIGGGAAGEGAATLSAQLGGRVALVERDLVGGICSFWACLPAKALLDSAHRRAIGADYPWDRASDRRDWMISREHLDHPDDTAHVRMVEGAGAEIVRGAARIVAPGRVEVTADGERLRTLEAGSVIAAVGSVPVIPPIEGLQDAGFWTSNDGTSLRDMPSSIVVLGGGPIGVELAQVYARFGAQTTLVEGADRIMPRDHPETSRILTEALQEDGVTLRTGVLAQKVERGGAGRRVHLSDGSSVEGAELLVAVGRRPADLRELGVEEAGGTLDEKGVARPDDHLGIGRGLYVAGDAAGGMQFTHLADYEGRITARNALGQDAVADLTAIPRTAFTDPEAAAIGLTVEEARERGIDAFEVTQDFSVTSRGFAIEPTYGDRDGHRGVPGHVALVVDREREGVVGAFAASPGAAEYIHLAVPAVKLGTPLAQLADTITAYPTGARVLGNLFIAAWRRLHDPT
ncbi:MAG TPA: NAD(P)/FAD-dependent oxidoreductase [Actinomycetota bacterium]